MAASQFLLTDALYRLRASGRPHTRPSAWKTSGRQIGTLETCFRGRSLTLGGFRHAVSRFGSQKPVRGWLGLGGSDGKQILVPFGHCCIHGAVLHCVGLP
jgi:hypothetical protein